MPFHELTFENMISCYADCISSKYKDSWGAFNDIKELDKGDELSTSLFKKGYLHGIIDSYQKQFCKMIVEKFQKMKEYEDRFSMSVTVKEEHDDDDDIIDNEDIVIDDQLVRVEKDLMIINLHNLSGWKDFDCVIELYGDNNDALKVVVCECLKTIGTLIHRYGVQSQKHNELGLMDDTFKGEMFRAMVYENMLEELYNGIHKVHNGMLFTTTTTVV